MSLSYKSKSKQRNPPPVLFLHPSPGASHVSLPGVLGPGTAVSRPHSPKREHSNLDIPTDQPRPSRSLQNAVSNRSNDRTDALWAEMQATLEEVELSASEGTHVFGPEHDQKLENLRSAQIALAQAWARSEADDVIETALRDNTASPAGDEFRNLKGAMAETSKSGIGEGLEPAKSIAGTASGRPVSSGGGVGDRLGAKLEEETEVDIILARKRREANDEYFQRVNDGVIDVVAKLEQVAVAMRAVEQESKDLWNENSSMPHSTEA